MTSRLRWAAFLTLLFGAAAIIAGTVVGTIWAALFFAFCSGAYAAVFVYSLPPEGYE